MQRLVLGSVPGGQTYILFDEIYLGDQLRLFVAEDQLFGDLTEAEWRSEMLAFCPELTHVVVREDCIALKSLT
jgi:hypothetical protein